MRARGVILATLLYVSAAPLAAGSEAEIRVRGAPELGERLGEALAEGFRLHHPDVAVRWEPGYGKHAFLSLLDGTVDVVVSTERVSAIAERVARHMGARLREYVLGYDALAVVVHPTNDIDALSFRQISALYTGRYVRWFPLEGEDRAVRLFVPSRDSGAFHVLRSRVLTQDLLPAATVVEDEAARLQAVARDPGAVALVSSAYLGSSVRVVPLKSGGNGGGSLPDAGAIHTGEYPLLRTLHLYVIAEPSEPVASFVTFLLIQEGQELLARHRFVPSDARRVFRRASVRPPRDTAERAVVTRVNFALGGRRLPAAAVGEVRTLAAELAGRECAVLVLGHASEGESPDVEELSLARARFVAELLVEEGIPEKGMTVEGLGATAPVDSNTTPEGRRRNRRVEIWMARVVN